MDENMDVDNKLGISHLYGEPKSPIAAKWLQKLSEGEFTNAQFKEHWRLWVPRAYTPEQNADSLEWSTKEEVVQQQLIDPLEEFICKGDPNVIFRYLSDFDNMPSVCGSVFKMGEPTYNCRDCGMDPTCVLCLVCFKLSEHKNHKYKMGTSVGGGCCDCGDTEAWKSHPFCSKHAQGANKKNLNLQLPTDLVERIERVYGAVIRYANQILTLEYSPGLPADLALKEEDFGNPLVRSLDTNLYCTVLYNDETHTFEQVINTLSRVIKCSQRDAVELVTNIDREGRAVVKSSTFQHCTELKMDIERFTSRHGTRPVKVLVVHAFVIAHQMFALKLLTWLQKILGLSESLRNIFSNVILQHKHRDRNTGLLIESILLKDSLLWKSARLHWHRLLIYGMFMEYENKKAFAKVFTKNYGAVLKDFIRDDHDHGFSIASLSVQIFPVPTLAQYLIAHEDVLFILLNTFISECSRKCNRAGKLEFDRTTPNGSFKRATYILNDVRYLLGSPPTSWTDELRKGFIQGVSLILTLLTYMQGMDSVSRQVGQHMEYEPEWESAFNLHIKLAPVITLLLKWCASDRVVLIKAYRLTMKRIFENPNFDNGQPKLVRQLLEHSASCIQYDTSAQPISIHLPLSRFLGGLHLCLENYGLTYDSPDFYHLSKQTPVEIIEPILRNQVMIAQVHAGMWRRNGYSLSNQIFFYHNVKCRGEMLDKDIVLLQIGASLIESNEFVIHLLNKFSLIHWLSPSFEVLSMKTSTSEEDSMKQVINMIEEFLSLLIVITGERYVPGVGRVTNDDCIKNEIMHQLFIHPLSHSEVNKTLPDDYSNETGIERVIDQVATYNKQPSGKGVYVIKPELLEKYNVFFYHYTKEEMSKSEEVQRKVRKAKTGIECCPPPVLPQFSEAFRMVVEILQCDIMLLIMRIVLERSLNLWARSFSEAQLHKILHLIGYALNEEEQQYITFFQFTSRAEIWGLERLLEDLTVSTRVEVHHDLINYILKKYRQIAHKNDASTSEVMQENDPLALTDADKKQYRAQLAAEKRARVMAQIAKQQELFMKENQALLHEQSLEDNEQATTDVEMEVTQEQIVCLGPSQTQRPEVKKLTIRCMICQANEVVTRDGPAMVLAAFVQKSTVLCRPRNVSADNTVEMERPIGFVLDAGLGPAPYASTCGHVMHSTCWSNYIDGILSKENRRPYRLRQTTAFDIEKNEYLCPLCNCLNNTVIPVIPDLSTILEIKAAEFLVNDVSFGNWYDASLVAVRHKKRVDEALNSNTGLAFDGKSYAVTCDEKTVGKNNAKTTGPSTSSAGPEWTRIYDRPMFPPPDFMITLERESEDENEMTAPENNMPLSRLVALREGDLFMKLRIFLGISDRSEYKQVQEEQPPPHSIVSPELLQMIQLFAQMAYTKGLEVDPHEEDPAVPMMAWKCCAYTIHTIEQLLRFTNKSLLGDLTARENDGLEHLVRLSGLIGIVWKNRQIINKLGVRILTMLLDNSGEEMSLADWDCFGLLVPLTGTLPSIYHTDRISVPSGSLIDLHIMCLLLIAQMAQTILLSDLGELTKSDETDIDTCCLQILVKILRSVDQINTKALWIFLKNNSKSFLRTSAIFYHFLTGIPAPPQLKEKGGDTYENLCKYLGLPTTCDALLGMEQTICLFTTWSTHPKVGEYFHNDTQLRNMNPINELISLPDDYSELLNSVSTFTCPNSDREDSRNPTMCLTCGAMLCSQTYCCQMDLNRVLVGACTFHAYICGAGAGIFIRIRECEILLLASPNRGCFLPSPYLDDYGEPDQGLRRGNPLHLSAEKYQTLQLLWLSHSIHERIARSIETATSLMPTQWQHL